MLLNRFLGLRMGSVILSRDRHGKHGGAVVRYLDCYFGKDTKLLRSIRLSSLRKHDVSSHSRRCTELPTKMSVCNHGTVLIYEKVHVDVLRNGLGLCWHQMSRNESSLQMCCRF
jgi:hypothetical protein